MTAGTAPLAPRRLPSLADRLGPSGVDTASTFERLLSPLDGDADARVWRIRPEDFRATPAGVVRALVHAGRREAAVVGMRLHPPRSHPYPRVHRWPAPEGRAGAVGRAVRAATGGIVVQLSARPSTHCLLDTVLADAGVRGTDVRLRPTRGGGVVAAVDTDDGPAMLRIGTTGASADPLGAFHALELLRDRGMDLVPAPLRSGEQPGTRWTLERRVPGRPARRLDRTQVELLASTWATMPPAPGPARAVVGDLVRIALLVPEHSRPLRHVMAQVGPPSLPGVLRHGDLWSGNVLVAGGRVTGVVDWGAWHGSGTPGADLLHLYAMLHRRAGESLGALWCREPWTWSGFRRLVMPVLEARDVPATPAVLEHIGISWWAAAVAGTLDRLPHRAFDGDWVRDNVTAVLRTRWC